MQQLRFSYRNLLIVWAMALAFGLGVESSRATVPIKSCLRHCNEQCSGRGGCETWEPQGCNCYYLCSNGEDGTILCGE